MGFDLCPLSVQIHPVLVGTLGGLSFGSEGGALCHT